jgi:hypothetical protein
MVPKLRNPSPMKNYPLILTSIFTACALSITASAEDLTVYANIVQHVDAHNDAKDFGVGHRRIRENEIRLSENGKVVGKAYSISSVVDVDHKAGTGSRVGLAVTELPEGTIWTEAKVSDMPHKATIQLGHQHTGKILGGTRAYAGIKGTYDFEVRKDGKHASTVFHIVREKK